MWQTFEFQTNLLFPGWSQAIGLPRPSQWLKGLGVFQIVNCDAFRQRRLDAPPMIAIDAAPRVFKSTYALLGSDSKLMRPLDVIRGWREEPEFRQVIPLQTYED